MEPKRSLRLVDLAFLGFNCVIGAGIFTNPGEVAAAAGSRAPLLYLVGAAICFPIALCFARMARHEPGTGGACIYARRAFGEHAGFTVGWVMWLSGVIGGATVALQLGELLVALGIHPIGAPAFGALTVAALVGVNLAGSRGGVWSNNLLSVLKLVPLAVFLVWALTHLKWSALAFPPQAATAALNLQWGLMLVLFSFSGFEEIVLPAGEVRDPERNVPRALLIVLTCSTVIYGLIQGAVGCLGLVGSKAPLSQATAGFPLLSLALTAGGVASLASVNASIAFTCPRSLWTLAELGWMPAALRQLSPREGPTRCILLSGALTLALVCAGTVEALVTASVLASLLQHLATCLAAWKEEGASPAPIAGTLVCVAILSTEGRDVLTGMAVLILVGLGISWIVRPKLDNP